MLTDLQIRAAKPREKPYKLPKEQGLTVVVYPKSKRHPKGVKGFRHYIVIWAFPPVPPDIVELSFVIEEHFQTYPICIERLLVSTSVWKQRVYVIHEQ